MVGYILALLIFALTILIIWIVNLIWFKPFSINLFFTRVVASTGLRNPEGLSYLRLFEGIGINLHNKMLNSETLKRKQKLYKLDRDNLDTLRKYDINGLNKDQQLSYKILEWSLQDSVLLKQYIHHEYPINQCFGIQSQLPSFMASVHQIKNKRDARYYIIRLSKFKIKFMQLLERVKANEGEGIIPPRFVIEKVLDEMKAFISKGATESFLYSNLEEKLKTLNKINEDEKSRLLTLAKLEIDGSVYPAYKDLIEYFSGLLERANNDAGVWKFPKGDEFYQQVLRHYTTTDLTPEEIHNIGLSETHRIQEEIRGILDDLGIEGNTLRESMDELNKNEEFIYQDTDEGRREALKDYQCLIDEIADGISHLFDIQPKAGVRVERVPVFKEKTAPGGYYLAPALDGSRPGIFYVNLLNLPYKYKMAALAYHEAIPGHHFQLAIQMELKKLPLFRKIGRFTAFTEGWALYAEKLAGEYGFYKDPYSKIGYLQSELFRAVRLVVDTGIHYKRWTREKAINYMYENTGREYNSIVSEIERYIVMPGQACAYKIGEIEILKLRDRAMDRLGEAFDIRKFHNIILINGPMPIKILSEIVDEYIAEELKEGITA